MPEISVVIPVYNAEKYLKKCLDSILSQTFQDFEIICVNDGSIDNSFDILKQYSETDKRIKIINQDNKGVSEARNTGINEAKGEYIQFVDADDWLETECFEKAYNKIKETDSDIVFFCTNFVTESKTYNDLKSADLYFKGSKKYLIEFMWTCWNKIIKRDFLVFNNLRFKKEINYGEDGIFNLMCLYKHPTIECLPLVLYNYSFYGENSISYNVSNIDAECKTLCFLINTNEFKQAENELKIFSINRFCLGILSWHNYYLDNNIKIDNNILKDIIKYLKNNICNDILKKSHEYLALEDMIKRPLIKKIFGIKKIFKK